MVRHESAVALLAGVVEMLREQVSPPSVFCSLRRFERKKKTYSIGYIQRRNGYEGGGGFGGWGDGAVTLLHIYPL